ncbi:MAG: hypothetical protein HQL96_03050 [Magnetococcales bacterium]|nr:hypothetical protein [Magnetococcales bacterium]
MKHAYQAWLLAATLLLAPLSQGWAAEQGKEANPIAKTASKVTMPQVAKSSRQDAEIRRQIAKDREELRKQILAKKAQKQGISKKGSKKKVQQANRRKPVHQARAPGGIPSRIGIRTWTFPESNPERTNKITELSARIRETENAYDAENTQYQRLQREYKSLRRELDQAEGVMRSSMEPQTKALENYKKAQEEAAKNPQLSVEPQRLAYLRAVESSAAATATAGRTLSANSARMSALEAKLTASQVRLNDILNQLDALQQHRGAVSEIVFLRSVKD